MAQLQFPIILLLLCVIVIFSAYSKGARTIKEDDYLFIEVEVEYNETVNLTCKSKNNYPTTLFKDAIIIEPNQQSGFIIKNFSKSDIGGYWFVELEKKNEDRVVNNDEQQKEYSHSPFICEFFLNKTDSQVKESYSLQFEKSNMLDVIEKEPGLSTELQCEAKGEPLPINNTWYMFKNHKINQIPYTRSKDNLFLIDKQPIYGNSTLSLKDMTTAFEANYTCVVCHRFGCISHTVDLELTTDKVSKQPSLKLAVDSGAENITAYVNDTVRLECPSDTEDKIDNVLWWKESGESNITVNQMNNTITILNVTLNDAGWYSCMRLNQFGDRSVNGFFLTVLEPLNLLNVSSTAVSSDTNMTIVIVIPTIAIIIIGLILVLVVVCKKRRRHIIPMPQYPVLVKQWYKKVIVEMPLPTNSEDEPLLMPIVKIEKKQRSHAAEHPNDEAMECEYHFPLDKAWEISRDTVTLGETLGEGAFGLVLKAECCGIFESGLKSTVAVKMLKDNHNEEEVTALVSEMEIMKMIGKHPNIINLLGCCTVNGPLYVIVEYADNGCLRQFLRNYRSSYRSATSSNNERILTERDLVSFSHQIARGMEYLASKNCVHRDLAARNVLVSANHVMKIADFGLARDMRDKNYYAMKTDGKVPVRWMAPESLREQLFTIHSDVWSFGILLWEIMTLGSTPYPAIRDLSFLYKRIKMGLRMDKPPHCSDRLYSLMLACWSFNPVNRPNFTDLVQELEIVRTDAGNHEYWRLEHGQTNPGYPSSSEDDKSFDGNFRE